MKPHSRWPEPITVPQAGLKRRALTTNSADERSTLFTVAACLLQPLSEGSMIWRRQGGFATTAVQSPQALELRRPLVHGHVSLELSRRPLLFPWMASNLSRRLGVSRPVMEGAIELTARGGMGSCLANGADGLVEHSESRDEICSWSGFVTNHVAISRRTRPRGSTSGGPTPPARRRHGGLQELCASSGAVTSVSSLHWHLLFKTEGPERMPSGGNRARMAGPSNHRDGLPGDTPGRLERGRPRIASTPCVEEK